MSRRGPVGRVVWRAFVLFFTLIAGFYGLCLLGLVYLRFLPPLATTVQAQRQVEAWASGDEYRREFRFVSLDRISPHLPRAAVAAEDGRFREHSGFDWNAVREARAAAARDGSPSRGASTITQQLVKNLFLTTHRSFIRKGIETTLVPPTELILGKDRILELYVNVAELGPGVFGAEAAAQHHYGITAADLSRHQAASLAAILPNPRQRTPQNMGWYAGIIQQRMAQMGW